MKNIAVELAELRNEVKSIIDHADERVIRMVYAMLEADAESKIGDKEYTLSPEQASILRERMESYERGTMKYSSWSNVKTRIKNSACRHPLP